MYPINLIFVSFPPKKSEIMRNSDLNLLWLVILPLNEQYFHLKALETTYEKNFQIY